MLLDPAIGRKGNRADVDRAVRAICKFERQNRRVVGRIERSAVGARTLDKACQIRTDFADVTDIPPREVNHVRSQITQDAVGASLVEPPHVLTGAAIASQKRELHVKAASEVAIGNELAQVLKMRHQAPGEQHHVLDPDGFGFFIHCPRLVSGIRQRLFAQDVQTSVERAHHDRIMEIIRRSDDQRM